ncbi:hypothetical protein F4774DRAFT_367977 [Daldinia eschscholtzii]|nr:hypothetical protein F4774DRAFT_367977 [Daldinia eschscholtzii]
MNTFPLLFDFLGARVVIVEDDKAPMSLAVASDAGIVVARAIESNEPWSLQGGIVGEKTTMLNVIETAEKIIGRVLQLLSRSARLLTTCYFPDGFFHLCFSLFLFETYAC